MKNSAFLTRLPQTLYTARQIRRLEQLAMEQEQITGFELMHRAAGAVFQAILQRWPAVRRLIVLVGTGNNGGDGYLVAVLAQQAGLLVSVLETDRTARLTGDALAARQKALTHAVPCLAVTDAPPPPTTQDTVVVDALLGTGLYGAPRSGFRLAIDWINASGLPVVAVDIPSGLCSDTGVAFGAVKATFTVCFMGLKQGLLTGDGPDFAGDILFDDLGIPTVLMRSARAPRPSAYRIDIHTTTSLLKERQPGTHKGQCGHVLVVGGDTGFGGAAIMAAEAAARTGAGTVTLLTRAAHVTAALTRRPELMVRAVEAPEGEDQPVLKQLLTHTTAIVIGPGLGHSDWSRALLRQVLRAGTHIPLIVDADALNLISENLALQREMTPGTEPSGAARRRNWILTPHPGEAARLLGCTVADIQADRFAAVKRLQQSFGGVCLLKGAGSLVCYEEAGNADAELLQHCDLCTEGNPGMASGGMGDVLTGIVAALIAQGLGLADSLRCAVCLHGEAADLAASANGERGLLASDILDYVRRLANKG